MTTATPSCTPPPAAAAAEQLMTQAKRPASHKRKSVIEANQSEAMSEAELHERKRARRSEAMVALPAIADAATCPQQQPIQEPQGSRQLDPCSNTQAGAASATTAVPGVAAAPTTAAQGGKGKSMLEVVFSPLFNVFNRGSAASAAPAAQAASGPAASASDQAVAPAVAEAAQSGPAPTPATIAQQQAAGTSEVEAASAEARAAAATTDDDDDDARISEPASAAAAAAAEHTQHAHRPPPPEVPAAAESVNDGVNGSVEEEDDLDMDFDPLLFIRSLPPLEECVPRHRAALLPRKTRQCKRKTLVLDLDETLVHSSVEAHVPGTPPPDFTLNVSVNHIHHVIHVRRRPHLDEFMQACASLFEVVVFTASQKPYADQLLNIIDPKRNLVKHRVFRDSCVIVDGNYLKDLTILGRDMATTCIVDNSPHAFGFQPDNGIPIESWFDDAGDLELPKLLPFLRRLAADDVDDVRPLIAQKFRLTELIAKLPLPV